MEYAYKIDKWERYQHYKHRSPPWIKLHYELISSSTWVMLDDASKLLAIVCMMLASRHDGCIPDNPDYVQKMAHISVKPDFQPLVDVGFLLKIDDASSNASKLLADASTGARIEKRRVEKSRVEDRPQKSLNEFKLDSLDYLQPWLDVNNFNIDRLVLRDKIFDYCKAKGKTYKDYNAVFRIWAKNEKTTAPKTKSNNALAGL
jgi:hypothetical protein